MLIKLGTRKSKLALAQSGIVIAALRKVEPSIKVVVHEIVTTGDKLYDQNLALIGGKGLFLKEIEEHMLDHKIDIAVHSMKDVPAFLPDGLAIDCMLEREDVRDVFISYKYPSIAQLPLNARVGTSSPRRKLQLLALRPDLEITNFRGNVVTRLEKLKQGDCDAIVLAYAGLKRLAMDRHATEVLDCSTMLPAIGQGAIGIECRKDDRKINELLALVNHQPTNTIVTCERAFMQNLSGDCSTPIAGLATIDGNFITLKAGYASSHNSQMRFVEGKDYIENHINLGEKLASSFLLSV